jgi:hypothetical protein
MSGLRIKCKIVSFEEVHDMVRRVSEKVKASGYRPDTIVGLARGGWLPARLMCDFLGMTDLVSLKVEHWVETGKTKDEATIRYPLVADFRGRKILVVDDITDTGKSLIVSTEHLRRLNPEEVRVAVMQYIPESEFRPDYFAEVVKVWTWFIYPWNWIEDTSTLIVRLLGTEKDRVWGVDDISNGLKESFEIEWDREMLEYILKVMLERGQVEGLSGPRGASYRLKSGAVVKF